MASVIGSRRMRQRKEAAVDEQPVPVLGRLRVVVGGGDAVQARLAPLKCPLVLPGLSQRLDRVVDGPQPCRPGMLGVETRP
ncbi:hypothetical protein QA943_00470 [Streptomyces sp. B21-097]|uniref:hypothetical protein n=1 Tax=Streptomyces sp. B21-097 TaxID=3039414 RepID=UPI002FEFE376